jgi:hypothetical protein
MIEKKSITKLFIIFCLTLVVLAMSATPVKAYEVYKNGFTIIPEECLGSQVATEQTKQCDINSFVQLFVNLAAVGLKVLPYLAMLMIIGSGFYFVLSGGSPQRIQQGKKAFTSVIIGVLIVIVLAWGLSAMIVYFLTGEEGGSLFPGSPFSKEWWGGGTIESPGPDTACCYIQNKGCQENITAEDCTALGGQQQPAGQSCQSITACQTLSTPGCCVPSSVNDPNCQDPNSTGCLDFSGTTYNPNLCRQVGQCVFGGMGDLAAWGCCLKTTGGCEELSLGECNGSHRTGIHCSAVPICTGVCCGLPNKTCQDGVTANNCTAPAPFGLGGLIINDGVCPSPCSLN